ncbi:hypothetical protein BX666DRAFT_1858750 [Dichotomocladium elegans]|nr:hypothetical protein BX666DRAFT_1858750 [Dichotomocladium elegans]
MAFQITPLLYEKIKHFAKFPQTAVSLRQMVMFGPKPSKGTMFKASQFLHEELPIRLAHRVKELDELPNRLSEMPSIITVKNWYAQSFKELVDLSPPQLTSSMKEQIKHASQKQARVPRHVTNPAPSPPPAHTNLHKVVPIGHRYYTNVEEIDCSPEVLTYMEDFVKTIEQIKQRHDPVVMTISQGILEYKEWRKSSTIDTDVQQFLDRFYMSRMGIRMLIGQHSELYRGPVRKDYVGVVCTRTNIREIVQDAVANARAICEDHYHLFKAPEVQVCCPGDIEFMYVPSHLMHMVFELLKNSLRAVVERYGKDYEDEYPPVRVAIAHGREDITIKISDEGGGIPRSGIPLVWTYMYTTAERQEVGPDRDNSDFKAPMAGFGYGLPLARLVRIHMEK